MPENARENTPLEAPWAWAWFDDSPRGETYGVKSGDEVICYTNREKAGYEDAKLIASCFNAVRTISNLHARVEDGYLGSDVCEECSDPEDGRWVMWPCPTLMSVAEASSDG